MISMQKHYSQNSYSKLNTFSRGPGLRGLFYSGKTISSLFISEFFIVLLDFYFLLPFLSVKTSYSCIFTSVTLFENFFINDFFIFLSFNLPYV